ncbi:unnamed protein product [Arctogadus glacialis]
MLTFYIQVCWYFVIKDDELLIYESLLTLYTRKVPTTPLQAQSNTPSPHWPSISLSLQPRLSPLLLLHCLNEPPTTNLPPAKPSS